MSKRRVVRIGILVLVCIGIAIGIYAWDPMRWLHRQDFRTGNEIVSRIDAFRASHKRLPENLKEVGLDDREFTVFYRKISDDENVVWFGTTLGESETDNSRTKKWE